MPKTKMPPKLKPTNGHKTNGKVKVKVKVKVKPNIKPKFKLKTKPKLAKKPVIHTGGSKKIAPKTKKVRHIAIAGNIGSGKTTLATSLAKHYSWNPQYEDVDNNPYLYDFYQEMERWSFNLQVYFLNSRFREIIKIHKGKDTVIQDRTIYEDAKIFAPNLHSMGLMNTRDFENYTQLFETIKSLIKPPDLLIYLRASIPALVDQIQHRGREYEDNLRLDYLKRLNERYEAWVSTYTEGKLLIINVDEINFADKDEDLGKVINKVDAELFGLF